MILVDTHVVIWSALKPKLLSKDAESALRRARKSDGVAIASMTLWELAQLVARGKIRSIGSIEASVRKLVEGYTIKELTLEIAALAAEFPPDFPGDPGDRIIGATARAEGMALVTADQRIQASPLLRIIW